MGLVVNTYKGADKHIRANMEVNVPDRIQRTPRIEMSEKAAEAVTTEDKVRILGQFNTLTSVVLVNQRHQEYDRRQRENEAKALSDADQVILKKWREGAWYRRLIPPERGTRSLTANANSAVSRAHKTRDAAQKQTMEATVAHAKASQATLKAHKATVKAGKKTANAKGYFSRRSARSATKKANKELAKAAKQGDKANAATERATKATDLAAEAGTKAQEATALVAATKKQPALPKKDRKEIIKLAKKETKLNRREEDDE